MDYQLTPINLGGVNAYLLQGEGTDLLIDTGFAKNREKLGQVLDAAGCGVDGRPLLLVLTHGDSDHIANATWVRERYDAQIAMHQIEAEAVSPLKVPGSKSDNRKAKPDRFGPLFRLLTLLGKPELSPTFVPDLLLEDSDPLGPYGFEAAIVHLPGHSQGSLGVLTAEGDLFCGDLLLNMLRPRLHFLIDDLAAARESLARLRSLDVRRVYPGHGKPFRLDDLR